VTRLIEQLNADEVGLGVVSDHEQLNGLIGQLDVVLSVPL
jgi:hypothetical protein